MFTSGIQIAREKKLKEKYIIYLQFFEIFNQYCHTYYRMI